MKIYSMTATFGKLEHATLKLQPGLNIIQAPNEWGKSTWCAFLTNMLYGIDTKARAKGNDVPDKERYAPWSGAAMSGRIDLCWNGRDITIERRTKGRIPFGEFRAYETATGIDVPELNAANCGQQLLGVERNVFTRAGFLRLADLPVTQDDALRRRLNSLVTTGDESGAGDQLGKQLKELKNKCRHNQTGLLPQAERERDQVLHQQDALYELQKRSAAIQIRQQELTEHIAALENHKDALLYEASLSDAQQVAQAQADMQQAQKLLDAQSAACDPLPSREEIQQKLSAGTCLQDQWLALQMESGALPAMPQMPVIPPHYQGVADPAVAAKQDFDKHTALELGRKRWNILIWFAIAVSIAAGAILALMEQYILGGSIAAGLMVLTAILSILRAGKFRKEVDALYIRHPGLSPDKWVSDAEEFSHQLTAYQQQLEACQTATAEFNQRRQALDEQINALTGGAPLADCQKQWRQALESWDALGNARRDLQRVQSHLATVQSMVKTVQPPKQEDTLTITESQTDAQLANARFEQRQLQLELGQCQGKADAIGKEAMLRARLDTLNRRITRLEDTYYALEMAQEALREATTTLQRRFAPRISKRTQELFSKLTDGRYQRITLSEDLSLNACTEEEDTLRPAQARSDGTVDQLYLALRLAVAEELTPEAPLVLDDALVRFDDQRLKTALDILKEASDRKQVILFTCQGRESNL